MNEWMNEQMAHVMNRCNMKLLVWVCIWERAWPRIDVGVIKSMVWTHFRRETERWGNVEQYKYSRVSRKREPMEAEGCVCRSGKNARKEHREILYRRRKCSKETNAMKIKRPRKTLTEKCLLDLTTRRSSVGFGRAISLERRSQKSDILI